MAAGARARAPVRWRAVPRRESPAPCSSMPRRCARSCRAAFGHVARGPLLSELDLASSAFLEDEPRAMAKPSPEAPSRALASMGSSRALRGRLDGEPADGARCGTRRPRRVVLRRHRDSLRPGGAPPHARGGRGRSDGRLGRRAGRRAGARAQADPGSTAAAASACRQEPPARPAWPRTGHRARACPPGAVFRARARARDPPQAWKADGLSVRVKYHLHVSVARWRRRPASQSASYSWRSWSPAG